MNEVRQDDGDRDDGVGEPSFFDETSFIDDGRRGFGKRKREEVPDQQSVEEEKIIIFDRLRQEKGEHKPDDKHLEERVGDEPEKPKDRVFVPRPQLLLRHGEQKINE